MNAIKTLSQFIFIYLAIFLCINKATANNFVEYVVGY